MTMFNDDPPQEISRLRECRDTWKAQAESLAKQLARVKAEKAELLRRYRHRAEMIAELRHQLAELRWRCPGSATKDYTDAHMVGAGWWRGTCGVCGSLESLTNAFTLAIHADARLSGPMRGSVDDRAILPLASAGSAGPSKEAPDPQEDLT